MEEEKKTPQTSEPNPNEETDEVNDSDLEDENQNDKKDPKEGDDGEGSDEEGSSKSDEEGKKESQKQSRKTDAEYAEERRQRKAREEAAKKKREDEIRRQAVFEVESSQVTPEELSQFGIEKVEDEDQLFLVKSLRKAKADGVENPLATAYQELYKKKNAEKADAKAKADAEERAKNERIARVAKDQADFKAEFGKSTKDVVENEPEFTKLFGKVIDADKGNFTECYRAYTAMKKNQAADAKKEGEFPTNSDGKGSTAESDEDFKKRYIAQYGSW